MDPSTSLIEDYQREQDEMGLNPPVLNSISLTEEAEAQERCDSIDQRTRDTLRCRPASLPPATELARHLADVSANSSAVAVVKDSSLELYHVMSVKQSLREDLAEHPTSLALDLLIGQRCPLVMRQCCLNHLGCM